MSVVRIPLIAVSIAALFARGSTAEDSLAQLLPNLPAELTWWNSDDCSPGTCSCSPPGMSNPGSLLKGIPLGECGSIDVGGSYRIRYHHENNMRRAGLTGLDDEFVLHQTRLWVNGKINDDLSVYGEFFDAASFGETFRPRANEVNRADLYQLYADVELADCGGTLTARLGRQEMRYGSARLIMAPNWANRRRSHDGVRLMWRDSDWDVDAFWVRPIFRNPAHFTQFDSTNHKQQLYGVFTTYKELEPSTLELYWFAFDLEAGNSAGGRYDTIASRIHGDKDSWLYEVEGGVQVGTNPDDSSHTAGFVTAGFGKRFDDVCWKPEVWVFYDWASGSGTTGNGFHHYVARAHYYLGAMDLFGRRNLEDANLRITVTPTEKLTCVLWYHYFNLADGDDVPYNLNMQPFNGLTAGSAGSEDLGHEIDLTVTYQLNEQTQVRVGYSHFWAGRFYDTTPGVPTNADADFFYSHFAYSF